MTEVGPNLIYFVCNSHRGKDNRILVLITVIYIHTNNYLNTVCLEYAHNSITNVSHGHKSHPNTGVHTSENPIAQDTITKTTKNLIFLKNYKFRVQRFQCQK